MNNHVRTWLEKAWAAPPGTPPPGTWLLDVASRLYGWGVRLQRPRARRGPIPVVSVGSIWSGGAGKTPLTAELARLAAEEGGRPAIVLRGYRGEIRRGPVIVDPSFGNDAAKRFGDEACMHARRNGVRVFVSPERFLGVVAAAGEGSRLAFLDDGMQHRRLARDLEIVTLPAARPLANGLLLPRGPLRAPPGAIERADVVVLAHADRSSPPEESIALVRQLNASAEILVWSARIRLRGLTGVPPGAGATVALVSGIARPGSFREAVEALGARVAWEASFGDHHAFTQAEIDAVRARAIATGIEHLLVTEKDEMRMSALDLGEGVAFAVADLDLEWQTAGAEESLRRRLRRLLGR
jgi:tetraacyldisaccharide 4'-kinase